MPTVLYGAETWNMTVAEKNVLNVKERGCLRSVWSK